MTINLVRNKGRGVNDRVVTAMVNLIRDHFEGLGFDGTWRAELFKQTGTIAQNGIQLKRKILDSLLYQVMPCSRDDSWQVIITPPNNVTVDKVEQVESQGPQIIVSAPVEEKKYDDIVENQMRKAKIVKHEPYGLRVLIDEKYEGLIQLCDVSPSHDKKELNKFPVGSSVPVVIGNIDKSRDLIICTINNSGIVATSAKGGTFTWTPNPDGSFTFGPESKYLKDLNNKFEFLGWIAEVTKDFDPKPTPSKSVHDWIIERVKDKSGATSVSVHAIVVFVTSLCKEKPPLIVRKEDGYIITELGWGELGGKEAFKSGKALHLEPAIELEPVIEPEPHSEPIDRLVELTAYIRNYVRYADVVTRLEILGKEKQELEKFIEDNKHLKDEAMKLHSNFNMGNISKLLEDNA